MKVGEFFWNFVEKLPLPAEGTPALPLTHGTKAIRLRAIIEAGSIQLPNEPCRTLGERLIFTYYGKTSFRVGDNRTLRRTAGAPTYFLLKPEALMPAHKVYPFDTGAFDKKMYASNVDPDLMVSNFEFRPEIGSVQKLVSFFFCTNSAYMNNEPYRRNQPLAGNDEAEAYYDVITSMSSEQRDSRESSIEIAFNRDVSITSNVVACAIIPDVLISREHYGKKLMAKGIDVRSYTFTPGMKADEYTLRIHDTVKQYYREKGFL
jgi:hypothetical protein